MFILICFGISLIAIIFWRDTRKPQFYPPGPKWLPFVGALPIIRKLRQHYGYYHLVWDHLARVYGPILGVRLGNTKVVVVSGREAIKELYGRDEMDGRPNAFSFKIRTFGKKLGVVFNDGPIWEELRKFSIKTLLNLGRCSMKINVDREAYEMVEYFKEISKTSQSVALHKAFDIPVLNSIWAIVAGERFELNDARLKQLMDMIHNSFRAVDMSGGLVSQFPILRYIPGLTEYPTLLANVQPIWKYLNEKIDEIQKTVNFHEPRSLIEAFLIEMKTTTRTSFTHEQLIALCLDFFQAGSETTSNTLSFGILYMLKYPRILDKVRAELDHVVGLNNLPTLNDRPKLKYVEAVICEIQRCANVAPMAIAHSALRDSKFFDYIIPRNTTILVSIYSLHFDPVYWNEPNTFLPDRFIDDAGQLIQHEQFLPFGAGKRRCMGENFSKTSMFLLFSSFVHSFEFEMAIRDQPIELQGYDGITHSPKPFSVKLRPRF